MKARVSVEAGIAQGWREVVGDHGRIVSIEHYGASADYQRIFTEFGVTATAVADAARDSIHVAQRPPPGGIMTDRLQALSDAGVSIWLDDLSRERIETGNLAELIKEKNVVGVTTNPTIFASAIADGERYDEQVRKLVADGADVTKVIFEVTTEDVRNGCDIMTPVYESTKADGRVSIEVEPDLANDTEATIDSAQKLWQAVDRPNVYIKIPATEEGLPAITAAIAQGINVNVTLIFSVERYRGVMDAYLTGLEQARDAGLDLGKIFSVASFFVSRVDTEVDKRLDEIGSDEAKALRGKAAVANAVLAYAAYEEVLASDRWKQLADAGANPQRPLWASTGVKNPDYSDTLYVTDLVVADTVNTMPEKTLEAFADHGEVKGDMVTGKAAEAQELFDQLDAVGDRPATTCSWCSRTEGVDKFKKSWDRAGRDRREADGAGRLVTEWNTVQRHVVRAVLRLPRRAGVLLGRRAAGRRRGGRQGRQARTPRCGARRPSRRRPSGSRGSASPRARAAWSATSPRCEVEHREQGLTRVVLCGMGGSSLAPEVICDAAGVELVVVDSSDPDFVRAALEERLAETVVVVSSKSGGTVETDSQRRAFEKAFRDAGIEPAERIVVVTDPGSPLEKSAREAGYRVFVADPDVGGRYSALSAFGLVPSGLAGADIGGAARRGRGDPRRSWRPTTPTTRGCGSAACWVPPTWPASTRWCSPTRGRRSPASATGPSS